MLRNTTTVRIRLLAVCIAMLMTLALAAGVHGLARYEMGRAAAGLKTANIEMARDAIVVIGHRNRRQTGASRPVDLAEGAGKMLPTLE